MNFLEFGLMSGVSLYLRYYLLHNRRTLTAIQWEIRGCWILGMRY